MPTTKDRVPDHTEPAVNARIAVETRDRVQTLAHDKPRIAQRLRELDEEWDIERAIEANASTLAFVGVALGFFVHPYWLALPALVTLFLFQHAVQGWCPPVPVLRRLGFRTTYEIERERNALKAVRGDFIGAELSAERALAAVELPIPLPPPSAS
ncbi:hypothetical protein RCO24_18865 [Hyphomicrobium sp. LHD-15]|nr:hypothetical protein [Hyphomicrobium sp. LHD-15]MDQ8700803.1 hypothetical protein [Hyphomicrobium sp. LHD-15]